VPGPPDFPLRHWYVVARADEVGDELLARQVCGQRVVLYRTTAGNPVALADRCSHRQFPLSAGRRIGDEIQCGYHGLRFDECGTCTWAPGQERIPSRANVVARPLVERGPWIWIWMGAPDDPDLDALPATPWFVDDGWSTVDGMEPLAAHYGLLIDNLLDLSHETFLHAGSIGTPEVAETPISTDLDDSAERPVVHVSRRMIGVACPPFYSDSTGLQSPIDRWQDIEYHPPGYYLLHVRVAPSGDESEDRAAHVKVLYAITPVDATHTLDFWAVSRDFAVGDAKVDGFIAEMNRNVVLQDVAALDLLQERIDEQPDAPEVSFKIDAGGLAARRVLRRLVDAEAAVSA
jgi:phenylpropionate dioxygenase-like ring-hydroxylating dioxygenase large terminal subunit